MTVEELIEELKFYDGELEVRFASQPSWPFEYSISGTLQVRIETESRNDDGYETEDVVYLEEGRQIGYLPSEAKEELGW